MLNLIFLLDVNTLKCCCCTSAEFGVEFDSSCRILVRSFDVDVECDVDSCC